ncbi:MAG TPA: efflux RND transporter periplasmic adaptor subunit [bacterium]|nr:efflux RND transporter periplasmic adaptor subunit [bacterium]
MPLKWILRYRKFLLILLAVFILWKIIASISKPENGLQVLRTVKAKTGDLSISVDATGEVKPYNRVEMKPPIGGRVDEVLVLEGDAVKPGQVLAWMSSTERAVLMDAARSQGEETFQRWNEAYKPAPLIAPLEGTVIVRAVEPGQTVTTADPIVVLADRLIVRALVDETDLSQIRINQQTQIRLDAYPDQTISGQVDHIGYESILMNNVNMYEIDILPETIPENFRSGMTANITFVIADRRDVLLLPSEAIAEWPDKVPKPEGADFAVYKKSFGGKPVPVPVRIGLSDGRMTEITKGLEAGTEVVVVRRKESTMGSAFSPMPAGRRGERKEKS